MVCKFIITVLIIKFMLCKMKNDDKNKVKRVYYWFVPIIIALELITFADMFDSNFNKGRWGIDFFILFFMALIIHISVQKRKKIIVKKHDIEFYNYISNSFKEWMNWLYGLVSLIALLLSASNIKELKPIINLLKQIKLDESHLFAVGFMLFMIITVITFFDKNNDTDKDKDTYE